MPDKQSAEKTSKRGGGRGRKKKAVEPASRGLSAAQVAGGSAPRELERLSEAVEARHGRVVGAYRDPLGGSWQLLANLPIDQVTPLRFHRAAKMSFDEAAEKMLAAARRFDAGKVRVGDLAGASGPPAEE